MLVSVEIGEDDAVAPVALTVNTVVFAVIEEVDIAVLPVSLTFMSSSIVVMVVFAVIRSLTVLDCRSANTMNEKQCAKSKLILSICYVFKSSTKLSYLTLPWFEWNTYFNIYF